MSSTTNPSRASRSAGSSSRPSGLLPHASSAFSQVAGVPGVPTPSPLVTASLKGIGFPSSRKSEGSALRGAVSRPSMVPTLPVLAS